MIKKNECTIDASGKSFGRVASRAAYAIMGKDTAAFVRNRVPGVTVRIINASRARMPAKKLNEKRYYRYSGYPGGLKSQKSAETVKKFGLSEIFERAVYGMLPKNKLRKPMMKNLIVTD